MRGTSVASPTESSATRSRTGIHPQHTERLAAYWAEALGGPPTYTESLSDETTVVRMHSGNGEHVEMDERAEPLLRASPRRRPPPRRPPPPFHTEGVLPLGDRNECRPIPTPPTTYPRTSQWPTGRGTGRPTRSAGDRRRSSRIRRDRSIILHGARWTLALPR